MFNLAKIYEESKEYSQAEEAYRRVLDLDPKEYRTLVNLSLVLNHQGKIDEAITVLETASKVNKTSIKIQTNLSVMK